MLDGLLLATQGQEGFGRVEVSPVIVGMKLQLSVEGFESFLVLIEPKEVKSQVEIHFRVFGRGLKDLPEHLNGLWEFKLALVDNTQPLDDVQLIGALP